MENTSERDDLNSRLAKLREEVNTKKREELEHRKKTNPDKTEIEKVMDIYTEELDPQVRTAVLEVNSKGYCTQASGFYGISGEIQLICGDFKLDSETSEKLSMMGASVKVEPNWKLKIDKHFGVNNPTIPEDAKFYTTISFKPETADLDAITEKWDQVANILPDRGVMAKNYYQD